MTRTTPTTDEQLFELLRKTDPLADSGPSSALEASAAGVERDRLLQRILSSERVSIPRAGWHHAWRRRLVLSVVSGGGVAVAAVAAVLAFTAGDAPSVAFAGWSADPTMPSSGQVQAAESECQRDSKLASSSPTLADTRGPYTLLVYAGNPSGLCVTGPSLRSATGEPVVAPLRETALTTSVAADAIRRIDNALVIVKASSPSAVLHFNDGRVGADVTAVALVLADGSRVQASVANGWFAAWWPGGQAAQVAEITTTTSTTTQQLIPPPGYETSTTAGTTGTR